MSRAGVEPFAIVQVPDGVMAHDEALGSKSKFWYVADGLPSSALPGILFKRTRANEDWSEKVAAELAALLGLPHARYELAVSRDAMTGEAIDGVVSHTFLAPGDQLVHGNEVLHRVDHRYARDAIRDARDYTVERVMHALAPVPAAEASDGRAPTLFVGYLLLDAWIGNTDRHHENWGLLQSRGGVRLAPTFDHATSLGRELTVELAERRLTTRDRRQTVEAYVARARSAFYRAGAAAGEKPVSPVEAWCAAAQCAPAAAAVWRAALAAIDDAAVDACLARVPAARISDSHRTLAGRILRLNRDRIENG